MNSLKLQFKYPMYIPFKCFDQTGPMLLDSDMVLPFDILTQGNTSLVIYNPTLFERKDLHCQLSDVMPKEVVKPHVLGL